MPAPAAHHNAAKGRACTSAPSFPHQRGLRTTVARPCRSSQMEHLAGRPQQRLLPRVFPHAAGYGVSNAIDALHLLNTTQCREPNQKNTTNAPCHPAQSTPTRPAAPPWLVYTKLVLRSKGRHCASVCVPIALQMQTETSHRLSARACLHAHAISPRTATHTHTRVIQRLPSLQTST